MSLALVPAPPLSVEQARFYLRELNRMDDLARDASTQAEAAVAWSIHAAIRAHLRRRGIDFHELRRLAS